MPIKKKSRKVRKKKIKAKKKYIKYEWDGGDIVKIKAELKVDKIHDTVLKSIKELLK